MADPRRMCLGCRRVAPQHDLIRLSAHGGRVRVRLSSGTGRSAYLCRRAECLEAALRRRAFERALDRTAVVDDETRRQVLMACPATKGGEASGTQETDR